MTIESWLPIGFILPEGSQTGIGLFAGPDWQILQTAGGGRALLAADGLAQRWLESGVLNSGAIKSFPYGATQLWVLDCGPSQLLCPVTDGHSPNTKMEAISFALAIKATRQVDPESALQDALYVESLSRLLPTYSLGARTDDEVILGYWLTGGLSISAKSFRRLQQTLTWLSTSQLMDVVQSAGFTLEGTISTPRVQPLAGKTELSVSDRSREIAAETDQPNTGSIFQLEGRPHLAAFFNEHVIDIVQNFDQYKALGIGFPSALILHGPPGCGKTFAVERLVDYLGWPSFRIDASSVASPYIHETSKKVAGVFETAMQHAPSVVVIDEMEAFLADREMGSGHHRVEEVAEFLRRIPEAAKNEVLVIGMTNRVDMIDPAVLRRGRFDHVIEVNLPNEEEIKSLLRHLTSRVPTAQDVNFSAMASRLAGRPLSDVDFVVREASRLAARSGKAVLDQISLLTALNSSPARDYNGDSKHKIGFV